MRFRICDNASQFAYEVESGTSTGRPWNIPLINIVNVGNYRGIWYLLLDAGLIDHGLVADMENMKSVDTKGRGRATILTNIPLPSLCTSEHAKLRADGVLEKEKYGV